MRSMLIIGSGRFGRHLADSLHEFGNEVMVLDKDEKAVEPVVPFATSAQIGDGTDKNVLRNIGAGNFDICFVCISSNFETSLTITMLLKELGAPKVVVKVNQDLHVKLMLHNGADDVIYPERDMARKSAVKYSATNTIDYMELSSDYGIFEIATPAVWSGFTIKDINVRSHYNLNLIAYREGDNIMPIENADYIFRSYQHLIVAGNKKNFKKLLKKEL